MAGMLKAPPIAFTSLLTRDSSAFQHLTSSLRLEDSVSPAAAATMKGITKEQRYRDALVQLHSLSWCSHCRQMSELAPQVRAALTATIQRRACAQVRPHEGIQQLQRRVELEHLHDGVPSHRAVSRATRLRSTGQA